MRRREMDEPVKVTFNLDRRTVDALDRLAAKADMERSRLARNIIEMNVRSLERCEKVGLFQMSILLRDLGDTLNSWVEANQSEPHNVGSCS